MDLVIPDWMAILLFGIAIAAILINGIRKEVKGENASRKKYYGKLMRKEFLRAGMHYAVVAVTHEESSGTKSAFIIINGQRNPEDEDSGLFGVEIPLQEVSDNDKLLIKAGDTITQTMEGKIIIVPP